MGNALWLFGALAQWYFSALAMPFAGGLLTAVPASGAVALAASVILALFRRETGVIWLTLGVMLSHALVFVGGLMRGMLDNNGLVTLPFLGMQLALSILMIY